MDRRCRDARYMGCSWELKRQEKTTQRIVFVNDTLPLFRFPLSSSEGLGENKDWEVNCSRTFEEKSRVRFTLIGAVFATGSKIQAYSE